MVFSHSQSCCIDFLLQERFGKKLFLCKFQFSLPMYTNKYSYQVMGWWKSVSVTLSSFISFHSVWINIIYKNGLKKPYCVGPHCNCIEAAVLDIQLSNMVLLGTQWQELGLFEFKTQMHSLLQNCMRDWTKLRLCHVMPSFKMNIRRLVHVFMETNFGWDWFLLLLTYHLYYISLVAPLTNVGTKWKLDGVRGKFCNIFLW